MGGQSSVGQQVRDAADRVSAWIADLPALVSRATATVPSPVRRGLRRAFSLAFFIAIGWVLYGQLNKLDWPEVVRSLPTSPWFYVCFLARYMILPVTEVLCYSAVWAMSLFRHFGVFLFKRILNASVAGASGDVYFLLWAVRTLRVTYKRAFSAVKDVTLLSAAAANGVAVVVLGAYLAVGDWKVFEGLQPKVLALIIGATIAVAVLSLLVIAFRGKILGVNTTVMWRVIGYHGVRSAGSIVLLGLQWWAGIPESGFVIWINLLIIDLLIARAPFIPAREFLFLSIALALAGTVDAPETQVKAMFLADTALLQIALVPSLIAGALWRSKAHPLPIDPGDETA
ncbi:MAG: hypothetical protein OES69_06060 [Myxococcales bacterium]|nr:hypothetical protein [Myxococcales bacterium]MDH3843482.1 hypothetical protein [Myxococcales bacterium]